MSENPSYLPRLFAELKRRKVFRIMAVYGATAFVLLQVADLLAEGMGLSDQLLRITTFFVLIGFPIAIVLAWAFESTPDGMKRTEEAAPAEIAEILAQPASRRWPAGLLALAGVALLFGGWWMGQRTGHGAELNLAVSDAMAAEFRTIAVLPFEDLGGNEENDPFLSGMHVDIHGKLMGLADLRVTALGSVRDYGSSEKSTAEIANELSVDYLLRGSVRRVGDKARVNVQLTDVAIGEDIWVDEFDREVTAENLFAIQSEIAKQVADRLEASLSPADIQRLEAGLSTDNLAAINAYHRGRAAVFAPRADDKFDDIVAPIELAVELAPEFVEAWSFLALLRSNASPVLEDLAAPALEAVERTEALAPGSLEAVKARGWYTYYVEEDFRRALELMHEAERMAPSDTDVLMGIAWLQHRVGEFAEGTRTMKRVVDLDPQNSGTLNFLASMLGRLGRWDAADEVVERALAIDPSNAAAQRNKISVIVQRDRDPGRGRSLAAEMGLDATSSWARLTWLATLERDYDGAARILSDVPYDETSSTARIDKWSQLTTSVWVEQMRGGNADPLRDSLTAFLGPDSMVAKSLWDLQAEARLLTGQEEAGWALLAQFVEEARSSQDQVGRITDFWSAALIYAQFGRPEEAFPLLDEAVARPVDGWWSLADLELDPKFDSLRDDPRFDALIARQQAYEAQAALDAEADGPWLP